MKRFLHLLLILSSFIMSAQDVLWEKSFGGKNSEILLDGISTPDYGFLVAGSSISNKSGNKNDASKGNMDYCLWKMKENGDIEWQKSFGGNGNDMLKCVKLTKDGGFIIAGDSDSDKSGDKKDIAYGNNDFWIIKLNAEGNEIWQKTIGGINEDYVETIILTNDGGYLIGGSSSSVKEESDDDKDKNLKKSKCFGSLDYWLVKLNQNGEIEWEKTYGGDYKDELKSIIETKDNFIIGGYSNSSQSGNKTEDNYGFGDYWILKLSKKGDVLWQKSYGGSGDDALTTLIELKDKNLLIAGNSNSDSSKNKSKSKIKGADFWVLKVDTEGEIIWQEIYDIGEEDILSSVIENDDSSILIGGYSKTEIDKKYKEKKNRKPKEKKGINDYIAIKVNSIGEKIWDSFVGSNGDDVLKKVFETRDGGYLFLGTSNGEKSRDKDSGIGADDYWIVKLKDNTKPEKNKISIEAFPNPAIGFTNVVVNFEYNYGKATLYDLNGRMLKTKEINGERTIPFDLSSYPKTLYVIEIKTNTGTESIKVIKN